MIIAVLNDTNAVPRVSGLWQWDYGQVLKICGLCEAVLKDSIEIHFALEGCAEAIRQIGKVEGGDVLVDIPDTLLKTGRNIVVFVYLANPTEGETVRKIYLVVQPRAKPQDYNAPEDRNILQQILESLKGKADSVELNGSQLYLTADGVPVGESVTLPSGGGGNVEFISVEEIDKILEGE